MKELKQEVQLMLQYVMSKQNFNNKNSAAP